MTTAAAKPRKPRRRTVSLREQIRTRPQSVDVAAGVILGVKVLGLVSDNSRRYLPQAVANAAALYEGVGVFLDHPSRPHEQRSVRDRIGWLENVRWRLDGLYADLHLLTSDPATAKILEAAQRNPRLFGLSHNAEGKGHNEGGTFVVEEITEVRSVDLVADPATNHSLFEGRTVQRTLRQLIEASTVEPKLKQRLLEMGYEAAADDMPIGDLPAAEPAVPDAAPAVPGGGSPRDALVAAVAACLASSEPGDHALALKIMKLLKPAVGPDESPVDAETPVQEEEHGEDDYDLDPDYEMPGAGDSGGSGDKKTMKAEGRMKMKSRTGEIPLTERRVQSLCKATGIEYTADLAEACKGADLDRALAVLALAKKVQTPSSAPRSSSPRPVAIPEATAPSNSKAWVERLLN